MEDSHAFSKPASRGLGGGHRQIVGVALADRIPDAAEEWVATIDEVPWQSADCARLRRRQESSHHRSTDPRSSRRRSRSRGQQLDAPTRLDLPIESGMIVGSRSEVSCGIRFGCSIRRIDVQREDVSFAGGLSPIESRRRSCLRSHRNNGPRNSVPSDTQNARPIVVAPDQQYHGLIDVGGNGADNKPSFERIMIARDDLGQIDDVLAGRCDVPRRASA